MASDIVQLTVELHELCPAEIVQSLALIVADGVIRLKVAVTVFASSIKTVQVSPFTSSQPDQEEKVEPAETLGVNSTNVSGE
jgi:hypothetical protein